MNKALKNKIRTTHIDTLIGRHAKIFGDIHYGKGLHIEGLVEGNVIAEHEDEGGVIIGESGVVEGEIRGSSIVVSGTVHGDIYAADTVEIKAGARVNGNVYYNFLEMAPDAKVNGNLLHQRASLVHQGSVEKPT